MSASSVEEIRERLDRDYALVSKEDAEQAHADIAYLLERAGYEVKAAFDRSHNHLTDAQVDALIELDDALDRARQAQDTGEDDGV